MTTALQSLASYYGTNWNFREDGYYVHRGRVYLAGEVTNFSYAFSGAPPDGPVTTTILTGLPRKIRPETDQRVTLVVVLTDTPDPATPGVSSPTEPIEYGATLTAAGDLILDSLPPYINDVPNGALENIGINAPGAVLAPDFTLPRQYSFTLGGISWSLSPLGDTYPTDSLAPYLDPTDFEDIDSTIAAHGSRVHLGGRVRALRNSPHTIPNVQQLSQITTGLPEKYRLGIDPDGLGGFGDVAYDAVQAPAFRPAIVVDRSGRIAPQVDTFSNGPMEAPGGWFTQYEFVGGVLTLRNIWFAVAGDMFGGETGNGSVIAGLQTHAALADVPPAGRLTRPYPDTAPDWFGGAPTVFDGIAYAIASFYPAPDWVAIGVSPNVVSGWVGSPSAGPNGGSYVQVLASNGCDWVVGSTGNAHPPQPARGDILTGAATLFADDVTQLGFWSWPPFIELWAQRPGGAMLYDKDPYNRGSSLLWRPSEISSTTISAVLGGVSGGELGLRVDVYPFWETRRNWILAGDVIDLTGAGWYGPADPTPSTVIPGPLSTGILPRPRVNGSTTPDPRR